MSERCPCPVCGKECREVVLWKNHSGNSYVCDNDHKWSRAELILARATLARAVSAVAKERDELRKALQGCLDAISAVTLDHSEAGSVGRYPAVVAARALLAPPVCGMCGGKP